MATQTTENILKAYAHLAVIRQATSDTETLNLCKAASDTIALDEIVINDGVDPTAELQKIKFDPFYAAINECNSIADASNSPAVKASCKAIAQALTAVIEKLI